MVIKTNELINSKIIDLWNEFKENENKNFCENRPLAPQEILKKNSLLFIGLNPSIRKKHEAEIPKYDGEIDNIKYKLPDKYYSKIDEISQKSGFGNNWTHFDLLFYRGSQKDVEKISKNLNCKGNLFIWKQLQISKILLDNIEPKLIVIVNSLAREFTGKNRKEENGKIYGEWLNLKLDEKQDYYLYKGIPVIFSKQPNRFFKNSEKENLINLIKKLKKSYNIN